jgi:hypothetical protein
VLVNELREQKIEARFEDSTQLSTTVGKVAAGEGITLSAPTWLDGVPGIVWRPLTDVEIEVRMAGVEPLAGAARPWWTCCPRRRRRSRSSSANHAELDDRGLGAIARLVLQIHTEAVSTGREHP